MSQPSNEKKVEECLEVEQIFTAWECEFLESIQTQLDFGGTLTEKQESKLSDLYIKACESPY
jgi:hypothetical protein